MLAVIMTMKKKKKKKIATPRQTITIFGPVVAVV
jgi:hypothetical protein